MEDAQVQDQQVAPEAPKMLPQDEVNRIVAREKSKAAESARREMEQKYQQDLESLRMQQTQHNAQVPRDADASVMYQQVREMYNQQVEAHKRQIQEEQQRQQMQQVANNYLSKVDAAKTAYPDFADVTKDFDPTQFPQLTFLLSGIENAGDILYDLAKNPSKISNLDWLATRSPQMAQSELLKLSQSINANKQAQQDAQGQSVSEPLDRLSPSRVAGSNGKMSIKDLRNQPWLRG